MLSPSWPTARLPSAPPRSIEQAEFPWDMVELLAKHDVLALPFPVEYGGLGGELIPVLLAIEELSRASAAVALILGVQELAALPLLHGGTAEQKERWVPDLASGKKLVAFALTESGAGSDASSLRTRATRDGDAWILNGEKRFISQGDVASLVAVFAVTDPDPKAAKEKRHLSCFYVEQGMPGFSAPRLEHKLGIRGTTTAELALKDVRVPDANRVGEIGDGWMLAMKTFERSRPGIAAQAVGIARGATDLAVELREDAQAIRQGNRRAPDGRRDAGRHGHAHRSRPSAAVRGR